MANTLTYEHESKLSAFKQNKQIASSQFLKKYQIKLKLKNYPNEFISIKLAVFLINYLFLTNYGVSSYGIFPDPTTCFTQKQLPLMIEWNIAEGYNYHTTVIEVDTAQNLYFGGFTQNGFTFSPFIGLYINSPVKSRLKWVTNYYQTSLFTSFNVWLERVIDIEKNRQQFVAVLKTGSFLWNGQSAFSQIYVSIDFVQGKINRAIHFNGVFRRERYQQIQIAISGSIYLIRSYEDEDFGDGLAKKYDQVIRMLPYLTAVQWVKQFTNAGLGQPHFIFHSIKLYNSDFNLIIAGLQEDASQQNLMLIKLNSVNTVLNYMIYQSGNYLNQGGLLPEYIETILAENYLAGCLSMGEIRQNTGIGFFVLNIIHKMAKFQFWNNSLSRRLIQLSYQLWLFKYSNPASSLFWNSRQ
eukprot:403348121